MNNDTCSALGRSPFVLPRKSGTLLFEREGARHVLIRPLEEGPAGEQVLLAWKQKPEAPAELVEVTVLGRSVGRKVLQRLETWHRLGPQLDHPNLARLHGLHRLGDFECLVTEHVAGCSVNSLLTMALLRWQRVDASLAVYICLQIAEALHHLHMARDEQERPLVVLHRSVSPCAIRLGRKGEVKLVALSAARVPWTGRLATSPEVVRGALEYAAPERLLQGRGGEDARSDLFSLGLVLMEMLTGKHLYDLPQVEKAALAAAAPMLSHLRGEARAWAPPEHLALRAASYTPEHLSQAMGRVPERLQAVLKRLLCREPEGRYGSAAELGEELRACLGARGKPYYGAGEVSHTVQWLREEVRAVERQQVAHLLSREALSGSCMGREPGLRWPA